MKKEDIDYKMTGEKGTLELIPYDKLRKFIIDFHNFLCGNIQLDQIGKKHEMTVDEARKVMLAISEACKNAPLCDGKPQGIKVRNIFVSPSWVEKFQDYNPSYN